MRMNLFLAYVKLLLYKNKKLNAFLLIDSNWLFGIWIFSYKSYIYNILLSINLNVIDVT